MPRKSIKPYSPGDHSIKELVDLNTLEKVLQEVVKVVGGTMEVLDLQYTPLVTVISSGGLAGALNKGSGDTFDPDNSRELWDRLLKPAEQERWLMSELTPAGYFFFVAPVLHDRVVIGLIRGWHKVPSNNMSQIRSLMRKVASLEYTLLSAVCQIGSEGKGESKLGDVITLHNIRRVFEEVISSKASKQIHRTVPSLRELVSPERLKRVVNYSARALQIPLTAFDLNFAPVTSGFKYPACGNIIRRNPKGIRCCVECDRIWTWCSILQRSPFFYKCHAGFGEFIAPVFVRNELVGTIIGGQIVQDKEGDIDEILDNLVAYGADRAWAQQVLSHHPRLSDERIQDAMRLVKSLDEDIVASLAYENWHFRTLEKQKTAIEGMVELVSSRRNLKEIFAHILDTISQKIECHNCTIWLWDKKEEVFKPRAWRNVRDEIACATGLRMGERLVGQVALTKEPILLENAQHDPRAKQVDFSEGHGRVPMQFFLAVPIIFDNQCIGVISVAHEQEGKFTEEHGNLLTALADEVGPLAASSDLLEKLVDVTETTLDLDILLDRITTLMPELLGARSCSVFLREDTTGNYLLKASSSPFLRSKINLAFYQPGEGLTGWVAKHGRMVRLKNVSDEAERKNIAPDLEWKGTHMEAERPCSILIAPLLGRTGAVIGVIRVVEKKVEDSFSLDDEKLLQTASQLLSLAVENAWTVAEAKRRKEEISLLSEAVTILNTAPKVSDAVNQVLKIAAERLKSECCMVFVQDSRTSKLILKFEYGGPSGLIEQACYDLGEGFTGWIAQTGESIIAGKDASKDPRHKGKYDAQLDAALPSGKGKSFIGVPLKGGRKVMGVLKMINKIPTPYSPAPHFTEYDKHILLALGTLIAAALERDQATRLMKRNLLAITHVGEAFRKGQSRDTILTLILKEALDLTNCEWGDIAILEERDVSGTKARFLKTGKAIGKYSEWVPEEREIKDNILSEVVDGEKEIIVEDTSAHPGFVKLRHQYEGTPYSKFLDNIKSAIIVPMLLKSGEVIGSFSVGRPFKGSFEPAEVRALLNLASSAAMAIYSDQLQDELKILSDISTSFSLVTRMEELYREIYRQISRIVSVDVLFIGLYKEDMTKLSIEYLIDEGQEYPKEERSAPGGNLGELLRQGNPSLLNRNPVSLNEISDHQGRLGNIHKPSASLMHIPLIIGKRVIGILSVQSYKPYVYTYHHLQSLSHIGRYVAMAIENARVFQENAHRIRELETMRILDKDLRDRVHHLQEIITGVIREGMELTG
ncbi:MAG: GAF domain-containing protein, partial [candidate division KSB1 bacterium]|nr:GAF domain-containing protein [candidate division KSB1 bacterium]